MRQYVIRRLFLFVPTLLLVSILIFLLIRVVPGDAALAMLGEGDFTDDDLERARSYLGLDRPLHIQYYDWIRGILTGDLGLSFQDNTPIGPEIARRMPLTIQLAFLTMIFSLMLAIPIGVISALKQDTWLDYGIPVLFHPRAHHAHLLGGHHAGHCPVYIFRLDTRAYL